MTSIATGSTKKNVIKERSLLFDGVIYLVMLFVLVVCLVPFLYIVAMSFSSSDAILNNKVWLWPVDFTLEAYREIIAYGNRKFWAEGYYVSTVGLNESTIKKYIAEQDKHDIALDKLSVKEYEDPFKGGK